MLKTKRFIGLQTVKSSARVFGVYVKELKGYAGEVDIYDKNYAFQTPQLEAILRGYNCARK